MLKNYSATFGINCGASQESGGIEPAYLTRTDDFQAQHPQEAIAQAITLARRLSREYLPNPHTAQASVRLLSLRGPQGMVDFPADQAVLTHSTPDHLAQHFLSERDLSGVVAQSLF